MTPFTRTSAHQPEYCAALRPPPATMLAQHPRAHGQLRLGAAALAALGRPGCRSPLACLMPTKWHRMVSRMPTKWHRIALIFDELSFSVGFNHGGVVMMQEKQLSKRHLAFDCVRISPTSPSSLSASMEPSVSLFEIPIQGSLPGAAVVNVLTWGWCRWSFRFCRCSPSWRWPVSRCGGSSVHNRFRPGAPGCGGRVGRVSRCQHRVGVRCYARNLLCATSDSCGKCTGRFPAKLCPWRWIKLGHVLAPAQILAVKELAELRRGWSTQHLASFDQCRVQPRPAVSIAKRRHNACGIARPFRLATGAYILLSMMVRGRRIYSHPTSINAFEPAGA